VLSLESICKGFGPPEGDAPNATYHQCDLLFIDECTAIAANMSGDSPLCGRGAYCKAKSFGLKKKG